MFFFHTLFLLFKLKYHYIILLIPFLLPKSPCSLQIHYLFFNKIFLLEEKDRKDLQKKKK